VPVVASSGDEMRGMEVAAVARVSAARAALERESDKVQDKRNARESLASLNLDSMLMDDKLPSKLAFPPLYEGPKLLPNILP
jgi:hypothetical protein